MLSSNSVLSAEVELEEALAGFDDSSILDDAMAGFDSPSSSELDDNSAVAAVKAKLVKKPSPWNISGQLQVKTAYAYQENAPQLGNADYRGFTKLQMSGLVKIDYRFSLDWKTRVEVKAFVDPIYRIKGREHYSDDSLNTYESELEINEAYVVGSITDDFDIKIGRQIVLWGKSDSIRITDVMNPLDNRELGLVDIENLRLPVLISRIDYYQGAWQFSLLAQHERRKPKEAAVNSEYFPTSVLSFSPNMNFPNIDYESFSIAKSTLSVSANGRFNGWDLSLYAGRFQDNRWHFENNRTKREYGLINLAGLAANVVARSWLLKTELAIVNGLRYNTVSAIHTRYDALLGVEYKGILDTTIALEVADRYLPNHVAAMEAIPDSVKKHNWQTAVRVIYNFNHDRATVGYLGQLFGSSFERGGFHRLWLDYELTQSVNVVAGVIDYIGGNNKLFEAMKNNDKLFVDVKLYF